MKRLLVSFLLLLSYSLSIAQLVPISELKKKLPAAKNGYEKYRILGLMVGQYMRQGNADSMQILNKQKLAIAQQLRNDSLLAETYTDIANAFNMKGNFEASLTFLLKGLHLAEEHHINDAAMRALMNTATLYSDMENYSEAIKYVRRAERILPQESNNLMALIYLNSHLAMSYGHTGEPQKGLKYLKLANQAYQKQIRKGKVDPYIQANLYGLKAALDESLQNIPAADSAFRLTANYSRSHQLLGPLCEALNQHGKFLLDQGKLMEAKVAATESVNVAMRAGMSPLAAKAAAVLSKTYDRLNQPENAIRYYRLTDSLQTKIYDKQRLNRLQDMAFTEQIRQQEEAAKVEEEKMHRRHNLQYAAIAVILISMVVTFLLISRKAARYPRLIEFLGVIGLLILFEFVNLLLHPFLGKLTHESPFLMLVLMVLIATMLVPLHHKMESMVKTKVNRSKPK